MGDIDVLELGGGGSVVEGVLGASGLLDGVKAGETRHVEAHEVVCSAEKEIDAIVSDVLAVANVEFGHVGEHVDEVLQGLVGDSLTVGE